MRAEDIDRALTDLTVTLGPRLSPDVGEDVLDWVEHNERELALEAMLSGLHAGDVSLTQHEQSTLDEIIDVIKGPEAGQWRHGRLSDTDTDTDVAEGRPPSRTLSREPPAGPFER